MEIPYITKPRPDTGLYNSKIGIWLFLASEIMLFGAFFSAYILLRVGAPPASWISGVLNIPIGTFNTVVLIASSVTVVMAWASLKMGNYSNFVKYQTATILCALAFVVIKSFEYSAKWKHYEVWLTPTALEHHQDHLKPTYDDADPVSITGHFLVEGQTPWFWTHHTMDEKGIEEIEFTPSVWEHKKEYAAHHEEGEEHHGITIKRDEIQRLSAYVPAHSTYFAIYFTMTGLHALHVIGGALVMGYLLVTSKKWWKTNPDQLANRVEVSGLFWHFVDLVWIFLFPILYLM